MKEKYDLSEERIQKTYALLRELSEYLLAHDPSHWNEDEYDVYDDIVDDLARELYDAKIPDTTTDEILKLYGAKLMMEQPDPEDDYIDWDVVELFSPKNSGANVKEQKEIPSERTEKERDDFLSDLIFYAEERFGGINKLSEIRKNEGSVYSLARMFGITDDDIDHLYAIYSDYKSRLPEDYDMYSNSVTVFTRNYKEHVDVACYIVAALAIAKFEQDYSIREKIINGFVDNFLTTDNTFVIDSYVYDKEIYDGLFTLIDIHPRVLYLNEDDNTIVLDNRHLRYLYSVYNPEDVLDHFDTETGEIHLEKVRQNRASENDSITSFEIARDDKIASECDRDALVVWAIYNHPDLAEYLCFNGGSYDEQEYFLDDEDNGVYMKLQW